MKSIIRDNLLNAKRIIEIGNHNKEFMLLIVISSILVFPFVFKGFATGDSIYYANGIEATWKNGLKETCNNFNGEIAFGYYLLLYLLYSIFKHYFTLNAIMNYFSAFSSIVMVCFSFFFITSLGFNSRVALFSCITLLVSPAIWLLSHYGHPAMPSLAFFVGSLLLLLHIDVNNATKPPHATRLLLFIIFAYTALIMRLDILLSFGAYFGILYYKKRFNIVNVIRLFTILMVIFALVFLSRSYVLGYFIDPTGGTFVFHLTHKLYKAYILQEIINNLLYWALGIGPFISVIALLGIISFGLRSSLTILLFSWVIPYFGFFPFHGMDFARLTAPTILVFSLSAVSFLEPKFASASKQTVGLVLALMVAQIVSVGIYYPLKAILPFKLRCEDRTLTSVPLGCLITDHNYRQKLILFRENVAKHIAQDRDGNILIVDLASAACYYVYYIRKYRDVVQITDTKIVTKENTFYFIIPDADILVTHPISRLLNHTSITVDKIHVPPFSREYPMDPEKYYLGNKEIAQLLEYEVSLMERRRKIISK